MLLSNPEAMDLWQDRLGDDRATAQRQGSQGADDDRSAARLRRLRPPRDHPRTAHVLQEARLPLRRGSAPVAWALL